MTNPNVVADVSPLIIPAGEKFEPTHVGCYDIPNAAGATGRVARPVKYGGDYGKPWRGALFHRARRTKLGEDGNQIMAHSAHSIPHLKRLFSGIQFGMDD
jgi:hypothetical protein